MFEARVRLLKSDYEYVHNRVRIFFNNCSMLPEGIMNKFSIQNQTRLVCPPFLQKHQNHHKRRSEIQTDKQKKIDSDRNVRGRVIKKKNILIKIKCLGKTTRKVIVYSQTKKKNRKKKRYENIKIKSENQSKEKPNELLSINFKERARD